MQKPICLALSSLVSLHEPRIEGFQLPGLNFLRRHLSSLSLKSLRLPAVLRGVLRPCRHSPYPFSAPDCLVACSLMILESSSRPKWRILAARVQASKTLGMSSLVLKPKLVSIESSRGSRARGQAASICGGTKLSLEELEFFRRHSREILDEEERFDGRLVVHKNIVQFFDLL